MRSTILRVGAAAALFALLCLSFASASGDRQWGLKALTAVFLLTGAVFGLYAVLLVTRHLPGFLEGYVFWDGPRFGTMGHPNICATVLMVSIGLTMGCALNAQKVAKVEQNTTEGDAIALISTCVSSIVTLIILFVGVLLFAPLSGILQNQYIATASNYLLPALFGCMTLGMLGRGNGPT